MSDSMIREGFLCPICMQDLGSVADLQQHFDVAHAEEDKAVIDQLKDFFGKAKQKILNNVKKDPNDDVSNAFAGDGNGHVSESSTVNVGGIDPTLWEPQELGATRSYTDGFKRYRDSRMDRYVVETNKLVIRLDKLLSADAPTDAAKRKAFEKAVVPWVLDADVNLCTTCGKSFSITRRRHHCRLCGGIICNKCSQFLPFSYAKKLTNPAYQYEGEGFRRSSSTSSLNSILSPEGEPHIRTCQSCRVLLEKRDQQTEQRNTKPFVVQLYQKMQNYIEEANKILPTFLEMAESLHSGETTYNLHEAIGYRTELTKLFENIDLISKRIYTLGTNDPEAVPSPTTLRLQKMIRSHATNFLQSNMMGLQALPSDNDLEKLREQKRIEAQQKIDAERRQAAEREKLNKESKQETPDEKRSRPVSDQPSATQKKAGDTVLGWIPQEANTGNSDDPMIQQINIIRGYVKQAKQANKWDEVNMLQENLRFLQAEYWRQQEQEKQQKQQPQRPRQLQVTQQQQEQPKQRQQQQPQQKQVSPQRQVRPQPTQQPTQQKQISPQRELKQQLRQQPPPQQQQQHPAHNQQRQQPPDRAMTSRVGAHGNSVGPHNHHAPVNSRQTNAPAQSQKQFTSPSKTSPQKSPTKQPFSKPPPSSNPFEGDDEKHGMYLYEDETNPFSENYRDPSLDDSLNPFS